MCWHIVRSNVKDMFECVDSHSVVLVIAYLISHAKKLDFLLRVFCEFGSFLEFSYVVNALQ